MRIFYAGGEGEFLPVTRPLITPTADGFTRRRVPLRRWEKIPFVIPQGPQNSLYAGMEFRITDWEQYDPDMGQGLQGRGLIDFSDANGKKVVRISNRLERGNAEKPYVLTVEYFKNENSGASPITMDISGYLGLGDRARIAIDYRRGAQSETVTVIVNDIAVFRANEIEAVMDDHGAPEFVFFGGVDHNMDQVESVGVCEIWDMIVADTRMDAPALSYTWHNGSGVYNSDGAGNTTALTDPVMSLASSIAFSAVNQRRSWRVRPLTLKVFGDIGPGVVTMEVMAGRATNAAAKSVRPFVRIEDQDYYADEKYAITTTPRQIVHVWETDPRTGEPWETGTVSESLEVGVRAES